MTMMGSRRVARRTSRRVARRRWDDQAVSALARPDTRVVGGDCRQYTRAENRPGSDPVIRYGWGPLAARAYRAASGTNACHSHL